MWVAPEAESSPDAINMAFEASAVDAGALLACYLPADVREQLPAGALAGLGLAQMRGSMTGSHLAPEVVVQTSLPADSRLLVAGTAAFGPSAISMSARGPALSLDTTVCISTPNQERLRAADTQVRSRPRVPLRWRAGAGARPAVHTSRHASRNGEQASAVRGKRGAGGGELLGASQV